MMLGTIMHAKTDDKNDCRLFGCRSARQNSTELRRMYWSQEEEWEGE